MLDPLAVFLRNTFNERGLSPIPLISTDHDVVIAAGLAVVSTHRLFKNVEPTNIEAVLTFPLPVHATLFELIAEVDGRILHASAQQRAEARRTYEDAIDRGKSAVLHEELLRGIHMISVANIQSGGEIKITIKWAMPLSVIGDRAYLRIPQTVGEVYGRSNLTEADALLTGGSKQLVSVSVRSDGNTEIIGEKMVDGLAKLFDSKPIDIVTDLWEPQSIIGNNRSGQSISLTLSPQPGGQRALNLAVMVDRSGSMDHDFGGEGSMSAHEAAKNGLVSLASRLSERDFVDLWEFDTGCKRVGSVSDGSKSALLSLVANLSPPKGGTEIGRSIGAVNAISSAKDILLLTDGLSNELDVEELSDTDRRISVILIGENSLESRIGHLAALTGGDIFIATAKDLSEVMTAAVEGLRRDFTPLPHIEKMPKTLECIRNNVRINAEWSSRGSEPIFPEFDRAAVAVATSLIVSCASVDVASKTAASEGIVTHLTSLVLVDEASVVQEELPSLRKVALPQSNASYSVTLSSEDVCMYSPQESSFSPSHESIRYRRIASKNRSSTSRGTPAFQDFSPRVSYSVYPKKKPASALGRLWTKLMGSKRQSIASQPSEDIKLLARQIDWGYAPGALIRGDLSNLSSDVVGHISKLAAIGGVIKFARLNGLSTETLVIGLLARAIALEDRRANRVWQAISSQFKSSLHGEISKLEGIIITSLSSS